MNDMTITNKMEAGAATVASGSVIYSDWFNYIDRGLHFLLALAMLAWWVRLWIKNPNVPPPGFTPDQEGTQRYKKPKDWEKIPLLMLCAILPACFLVGCASMVAEIRESKDGEKTTLLKVRTFWDAKSELAKAYTSNTDKTQSVRVSGLAQESSSSNAVALVEGVVRAAVESAVKVAKPVP